MGQDGFSTGEIAKKLGITTASVSQQKGKILRDTGINLYHQGTIRKSKSFDWPTIQLDMDAGMSSRDICKKYKTAKAHLTKAIKEGVLVRDKLVSEMSLLEYLELWKERDATSHFRRWVKKNLVKEGYCTLSCAECGLTEWRGKPAPLELDHIDGDPTNNVLNNLRILCLHCHTQTETFGWRNVHRKKKQE